MIRYRDGKIVSTKGERFTQVTKEESEELKKSYVSWQPKLLRDLLRIFEMPKQYKNDPSSLQFEYQPTIMLSAPLWLIITNPFFICFKEKFFSFSIKEQIR